MVGHCIVLLWCDCCIHALHSPENIIPPPSLYPYSFPLLLTTCFAVTPTTQPLSLSFFFYCLPSPSLLFSLFFSLSKSQDADTLCKVLEIVFLLDLKNEKVYKNYHSANPNVTSEDLSWRMSEWVSMQESLKMKVEKDVYLVVDFMIFFTAQEVFRCSRVLKRTCMYICGNENPFWL